MSKTNIVVVVVIVLLTAGVLWYFSVKPKQSATQDQLSTTEQAQTQENTMDNENVNNTTPAAGASELKVVTTQEGTGPGAAPGNIIAVNYTGKLTNGTVFDSNVDPKFGHVQPFVFTLGAGQVIAGWDQGILGMKAREKRTLTIPAKLAYGDRSPSPLIPANSDLVFEVELLAIKPN